MNFNQKIKIFHGKYIPKNLNKFNLNKEFIYFSGIGNPDEFGKNVIKLKIGDKIELKSFLLKRGVTEEEISALVKANHVSVLRDAMLYNKGKRKVVKRANNTNGTKVLRSGSKKAPKKTDAYKKTTSRLKKNGNWQDAQSAISMLLNN